MKGSPLLRLAVILMLLTVVLWPVLKITGRVKPPSTASAPTGQETTSPSVTSRVSATLLLHAAPSPGHCSITQNGVVLLTEANSIAPGEYRVSTNFSKGEDLVITADWPDEEPHALRAEVLVHGYQAHLEKTFWGQKRVEDVLPVPESFLP